MKTNTILLSKERFQRLQEQGYTNQSRETLSQLAFGIRFPYRLCVLILALGVLFSNIPTLSTMFFIAFLGVILPNHPLDYIYNFTLRQRLNKPKVPPRTGQLKFACSMATAIIGLTIYLFLNGYSAAAYTTGALLITVAFLVGSTDICIPSKIYNKLFSK